MDSRMNSSGAPLWRKSALTRGAMMYRVVDQKVVQGAAARWAAWTAAVNLGVAVPVISAVSSCHILGKTTLDLPILVYEMAEPVGCRKSV